MKAVGRALGAGLIVLAIRPEAAEATSDGGRTARLLGASPSHAVVVEVPIQVPCDEVPCRAYAVDLRDPDQPRSHQRMISKPSLEAYLAAGSKRLGPVMPERDLTPLEVTASGEGVAIASPRQPVTLELVRAAGADAMAAHERTTDQLCLDPVAGPLCAGCRETTRFASGREVSFWACDRDPGPWRGEPFRPADCDCHAEAPIVAARLEGTGGPTTGSLFVVAPHQLGQNVVGGTRASETSELALRVDALAAYLTPRDEIVVVGSAIHAPALNGTHFPLVASTRFATAAVKSNDGGAPAPFEVSPGPPPRGRGPACRGCSLTREPAAPSLLSLVAVLGLVTLRRRR